LSPAFLQVYPFVLLVPLIERGFGSRDVTLLGVVRCSVSIHNLLSPLESPSQVVGPGMLDLLASVRTTYQNGSRRLLHQLLLLASCRRGQ
jgi:hypothetical protein